MDQSGFAPGARRILVLAAIVIVILGMRAASSVISPILFALFVAIIWSQFPAFLRRRGVPTRLASIAAVIVALLVTGAVAGIVTLQALRFDERVPTYEDKLTELEEDLEDWINGLPFVEDDPIDLAGLLTERLFDADLVASVVQEAFQQAFGLLGLASILVLVLLFMLSEAPDWSRKLQNLAADGPEFGDRLGYFASEIQQWLAITFWMALLVSVPSTIVYMLFGIDFAILWGMLMLILSYIPSFGFIFSLIPPVLLALLLHGPATAATVLAIVVVINFIVDNLLKPRVTGRSLNLSPLVLIIAVIFWSWVLGPLGAFLSTPLTLLVRFALQTQPDTHWLADLLGDSAHGENNEADGEDAAGEPSKAPVG